MSGPKVIRIVTREEKEKRCQVQISKLELEVQRFKAFAKKNESLDKKLEAELESRLHRFNAQDADEYEKLEREIPQQLKILKTSRRKIEEAIEKKAVSSRKLFNNLLKIRKQLMEHCASEDLKLPTSIAKSPSGLLLSDSDLETFRQQVNQAQAALFPQIATVESALSTEQKELGKRLGLNLRSSSFEHWKGKVDAIEETPQVTRLNKLLSQLKMLEEGGRAFAIFTASANSLLEKIDDPYSAMRCDSLILELSGYIEKSKVFTERLQTATDLFLEIEVYLSGDLGDESSREYEKLKNEFASCESENIEVIISRATTLRDEVKNQFEGESRRQVILQGLADLGYSVSETLQTVWVKDGSLVLAKSDKAPYGVELVGNAALDKCQVRVVGAEDRNTGADKAAEETWCEDFASMHKKLSNDGTEISVQKATLAGEVPLKVYSEGDNRWKKRAGVQGRDGRYLKH